VYLVEAETRGLIVHAMHHVVFKRSAELRQSPASAKRLEGSQLIVKC
jgi:hypothetical protein